MSNNNNGILSGITAGLQNTYAYLASQYPNGLTLENINEARGKTSNANVLNQSFATYLQNNFKSIDKDGDGKITEQEMNNLSK
jgi:Ca2+-binding EF-hand superfamily protein